MNIRKDEEEVAKPAAKVIVISAVALLVLSTSSVGLLVKIHAACASTSACPTASSPC